MLPFLQPLVFFFAVPSFCSRTFWSPFPRSVISAGTCLKFRCRFVTASLSLAQHLLFSRAFAAQNTPVFHWEDCQGLSVSALLLRDRELSSYQGDTHFSCRVPVIPLSVKQGGILQPFYIHALIYFARAFLCRKCCISLTRKTSLFLSPSIRSM